MGWWGKFCYDKPTMAEVRNYIEKDTGLTVKSVKFGYAICVYDEQAMAKDKKPQPDLLNYIMIALWNYSGNQLMIKQVSEDMGPCERDVPMKYINAPCKATENSKFATEWRENVRQYHIKRKKQATLARFFARGENFFVYGERYIYCKPARRGKDNVIGYNTVEKKEYRIRPAQISMTQIPLPTGCVLRNKK